MSHHHLSGQHFYREFENLWVLVSKRVWNKSSTDTEAQIHLWTVLNTWHAFNIYQLEVTFPTHLFSSEWFWMHHLHTCWQLTHNTKFFYWNFYFLFTWCWVPKLDPGTLTTVTLHWATFQAKTLFLRDISRFTAAYHVNT